MSNGQQILLYYAS